MTKVIIAIHGRANKPKKETLCDWWKTAIAEGLSKNLNEDLGNIAFEMAYYADICFDQPLSDADNKEPYKEAKRGQLKRYSHGTLSRIRAGLGSWLDTPADWLEEHSQVFSSLAKTVAQQTLKDLGQYYTDKNIRERIKKTLKDILVARRDDEIFLVSHSMGTIVAYDVLREIGRSQDLKGLTVEHFVTMGSPLGLTPVKGNIIESHNRKLRTPSCITRSWLNFSDPEDFVCIDSHLRDEYERNSASIKVKDVMVCNDYPDNAHKSFGYLRTPEFSEHILRFL